MHKNMLRTKHGTKFKFKSNEKDLVHNEQWLQTFGNEFHVVL